MKTKTFPKSRVCVIDACSSLETGVKQATDFAKKHNISLNSIDGHKIIFSFCLRQMEEVYSNTNSQYAKVICVSNQFANKRITSFIDRHINRLIKRAGVPYCGRHELTSPDLEFAAQNSLAKQLPIHPRYNKTKLGLKL